MSRRPGKEVLRRPTPLATAAATATAIPVGEESSYRPGKGKSIPAHMIRQHLEDDSGPRHPRTRGVSASARRERVSTRYEQSVGMEDEEESVDSWNDDENIFEEDGDDYIDELEVELEGDRADREITVRKGKGGRFVSTSGTTTSSISGQSRKKTKVDDSWVVKQAVPGGPVDGSVIPSFLGHIARRIWDGKERESSSCVGILKCQNRDRACANLRTWYESWMADGSPLC